MTHDELPKFVQKAYARLVAGAVLCRTSSPSDEAVLRGGGFLYTTEPGGKKFPTASGKMLIENGLLASRHDGLLDEVAQTFEVVP